MEADYGAAARNVILRVKGRSQQWNSWSCITRHDTVKDWSFWISQTTNEFKTEAAVQVHFWQNWTTVSALKDV